MHMLIRSLIGLSALGAIVLATVVLSVVDVSNHSDLDTFIEKKMDALQARGLAVAFLRNGRISWSGNYGYADAEAGMPITDETVFQVASLSKMVTAVAVMQLAELQLLDLDAPINAYLPFEIVNPHHPEAAITTRMLLQHRSSLIDHSETYRRLFTIHSGVPDPEVPEEEALRRYFLPGGDLYDAQRNFSRTPPGEERHYTNLGFGLLGFLVERASGRPFNAFTREHIFTPLGMASTGWFSSEVDMDRLAVAYDGDTRLDPYSTTSYPASGLRTTVSDFAKFVVALSYPPESGEREILDRETLEALWRAPADDALVWHPAVFDEFLVNTGDADVRGHSGGDPGYSGLAAFNREAGTGMIVFMNGAPSLIDPSPLFLLQQLNFRAPYRRLAQMAGVL